MPIQAIVFDFDGVLADSERLHFRSSREVFASFGVDLSWEDYCSTYIGYDDAGMFAAAGERYGWRLDGADVEALIREKARIFDALVAGIDVLYPSARGCVERLARSFPLGVASGALPHEIDAILTRGGIRPYFRFIVGAGDTPASKPAPDPYLRAAELHGLAPAACVAIEDTRFGIQSARAAGLWCVGVAHTYPAEALSEAHAVIPSLDEFTAELIESLR